MDGTTTVMGLMSAVLMHSQEATEARWARISITEATTVAGGRRLHLQVQAFGTEA